VRDLGKKLQAAVDAATEMKPLREVRRRVRDVFTALAAAEKKAPRSEVTTLAVTTHITLEMIDRAAAQYSVFLKNKGSEAYLDGLGFAIAARELAKKAVPPLTKRDPAGAKNVNAALALVARAYPGVRPPEKQRVSEGDLLAAASRAKLAVSNFQ
jgi:hypothetical protein